MIERPLSVLKFGSSVLGSEEDLPIAVTEIYRELRKGHRIVAVVSAFAGATDRLLEKAERHFGDPQPTSLARLLATGETVAAASLGMVLDDVGVPNVVLEPHDVTLRTRGPVLDAEPDSLDVAALQTALREVSVVVLSGFAGQNGDGRPSLLGRGGSDLTALFLARQLGAHTCRLIKDVDGLYTVDPHEQGDVARRYQAASWEEALRVGGKLVQSKAVRYAQQHDLSFIVCAAGAGVGTKIGSGESKCEPDRPRPKPLRVGLAGLGTVGLGVYRWLRQRPAQFEIVRILVEDLGKPRPDDVAVDLLTDDAWNLFDSRLEVVVELIGGTDTAGFLLRHALAEGLDVVTANKALIASTPAYLERSGSLGDRLFFSASVGGAVPVLERLSRLSQRLEIEQVEAVLNGTCNYVLDRMSEGCGLQEAIREAQDKGFAERDPGLDVSGMDAACKLAITAAVAFGVVLDPNEIPCEGIDRVAPEVAQQARAKGTVLRLVARLSRTADGWQPRVALMTLPSDDPLAKVRREENAVVVRMRDGRRKVLWGKGAGRWPTTVAVVGDLLDLYRRRSRDEAVLGLSIP